MASWHTDFLLGDWLISPKLNKISRDGQSVSVKHKSMAVIAFLADAKGEVVTRNEIMDSVWPGMEVTDDVLTQSIVELRKAFVDDAKKPLIIETIPRVGFRLIASIRTADNVSPTIPGERSASKSGQRHLIAAFVTLVLGAILWTNLAQESNERNPVITVRDSSSIAVLPFTNLSDDPDNEYFSEGMSDEIRNLLGQIPDLKVIGRTSSHSFKGRDVDLRDVGLKLGVSTLLEGSVRKSGDRVRITMQLIDSASGVQIWSDSYDRLLTDIFAVQDDVSNDVIAALQIHVGSTPKRGRPTHDLAAYELFLKARDALGRLDFLAAAALLSESTQLDPNFAEAYEALAFAYWNMAGVEIKASEAQALAGEVSAKALAIDPDLVYAGALHKAAIFGPKLRLRKLEALELAIREQPDNVMILDALITLLAEHGYMEDGLHYAERLVELDPLSMIANFHYSTMLYAVGRTSDAMAVLEITEQANLDPTFWKWTLVGMSLVEGRNDDAIEYFESWLQRNNYPNPGWFRAIVTEGQHPGSGQAYLDDHIPRIIAAMPDDDAFDWQFGLTVTYLYFGFLDRFYEQIYATGPTDTTWGGGLYLWVGNVFRQQGFVAHPRYLEITKLLGIIDTWEQRGPPDFCKKVDSQWTCE